MKTVRLIAGALLISWAPALEGGHARTPQMVARADEQSPRYGIAFASFAPLNTELFIAQRTAESPSPCSRIQTSITTGRSRRMDARLSSPRPGAAPRTSTGSGSTGPGSNS